MSEINSQNYIIITGSFVPIRDNNNNLLSITSSDISLNDESHFIEWSSSYYYTSESIAKIINTEFTELTIVNNKNFEIPSGAYLISQSEYDENQSIILNLESNIITSQSFYEIDLDSYYTENSSLLRTVQSVNDSALRSTNLLIKKYTAAGSTPNEVIAADLNALKSIWYIPFNDIITNTGKLTKRNAYYSGSITYYSSSIFNNSIVGVSETFKNQEVTYSLSFDGSYLDNLFADYLSGNGGAYLDLLAKIVELEQITGSLLDTIIERDLQIVYLQQIIDSLIAAGSGSGGGVIEDNIGKINILIRDNWVPDKKAQPPLLVKPDFTGFFNNKSVTVIPINTTIEKRALYKKTADLELPWNTSNGTINLWFIQPVGKTQIDWTPVWSLFDITRIQTFKVLIDGVLHKPLYDKNDINNLVVSVYKDKITQIEIIVDPLIV